MRTPRAGLLLIAVTVAGCATAPLAPRVAVMPAPNKPFDVFVAEDRLCRQYAEQSVGVGADDPAGRRAVESAIVGTTVGALAGAALGGRDGAAAGAGVGLLAGSAVGAGEAGHVNYDLQRRYDIAYQQCMYAKGNQLPGYYRAVERPVEPVAPAPASRPAPYPPPNYPPPPPPPGR